ncbi:hypothetical protein Tsubulata_039713 [Turnera subulata]|uniref:Uncharacterized protein n=1 Tax=Turnera subulata TaxID=218843 RepID=A0A9Q0J0L1_9ROSI|nr:hypothetical protein Tsubulata_039713 [Turnera subulata]
MESDTEAEQISIARLPLLITKPYSPETERSGTLTPPHHSLASVPFRWEEEPGKPRGCNTAPCTPMDLSLKTLELPPRLFLDANVPSPTTVLDGPDVGRQRFQSSSFRIIRKEFYGSFRRSFSPERGQLGGLFLSKRRLKEGGFLASWGWGRRTVKGKRDVVGGGSYVFPSSVDKESDCGNVEEENSSKRFKMTRTGSYSSLSHARPQLWATIYEGLKQVVPWRRRKQRQSKDGLL